ncbi:hypothetical protein L7F22_020586 [Adiantum nelumboides]|nr:hypothetical protein [Adiantum nelumboides]
MYMNGSWSDIAWKAGVQRCGKSCRRRWMNHLRPDLKRGRFTPTEISRVVELHNTLGNRWSEIAGHLVGRTDNDVKNLWNTQIKRQLKLQQMSSASAQLHGTDSTMESTGGAYDALIGSAPDEPKQDQSIMGEQDESSAASDTSTNPRSPGRGHSTIKSDHILHINVAKCASHDLYDYSIAQQGASSQGKCKGNNILELHNRKGNASKPLKKHLQTSKHSTSIQSVFAFPFSCTSIPASAPQHHLPFEHPDLNNDDEELIITDDTMKNGARMLHTSIIGIPHAHSSSNFIGMLPSAPAVPCADHELPFTSSPVDDRAGERFAPRDAEAIIELQPAAEARSIASCSNCITRARPPRIADTDTASANPIIRKKATMFGLTQPRTVPLPLPLAAQYGQQYWCSRSKEQEVKQQHLPEMLALAQERPTALTYSNVGTVLDRGALEKLQQACTSGVDYNTQYRSVACADSDTGTASCCVSSLDMDSTSAGCSELVQKDHGFYVSNDAANVCAAAGALSSSCCTTASWWSVLDVDMQVPEFQLLTYADYDQCCWQPLADMFEP